MGAWSRLGKAAAIAAVLCCATRSGASTVVEPIARLSLEGAYDSNALYDGKGSDNTGRISPDLGLRLHAPLWDLRASYGGDWIYYQRLQPGGTWNHRGLFSLRARPTERTTVDAALRAAYAFDPVGLAQLGVFVGGRQSALILGGRGRVAWRADRRWDLVGSLSETTVRFEDRSGGAMHAPSIEMLYRATPRWTVGGGYALGVFQTFDPHAGDAVATSHTLRARARYALSRRLSLTVSGGPALWSGPSQVVPPGGGPAVWAPSTVEVIPEISAELLGASPNWDLRLTASRAFGIGYLGRPGLVNLFEFGGERRFQRRYFLRSIGGIWDSGEAPTGKNSATGYAVTAEAGTVVGGNVRISLAATHFGRMNDPSPEFRRTTVGLRLGWELPLR